MASPHQLYLIYGNNEAEVGDARYSTVSRLLTPAERDAGLTEIRSAGNQPLTLDRALNEIVSELGTASFIPGSKRVVVIYDLADLFEKKSGGKGAAPSKAREKKGPSVDRMGQLVDYLANVLPTTENIAIFVCHENEEKGKSVSPETELFRLIQKHGTVIEKRDKPLNFEFEDTVLSANPTAAVSLLRDWLRRSGSDSGARLKIFQTVAGIVELTFQARCVQEAKEQGLPETQVLVQQGFPALNRVPAWKIKKIHTFAQRFSLHSLQEIIESLNRLQAIMYPTGEEDYIPSWEEHLELLVLRLTAVRG